jgi:hypothetical protein
MIELIATIIITASSVLLFGYWFRYTCLLILNTKTATDYAAAVAAANQLHFVGVQAQLRQGVTDLDGLRQSLDSDYKVLSSLLKSSESGDAADGAIESRMLEVNYRLMRMWYTTTRTFSTSMAAKALDEMSMIVAHFANTMGERNCAAAAA